MQSRQKALNLLGLAERAGKIISGQELVLAGLKAKKIKVVILANDCHEGTSEKVNRITTKSGISIISAFNSDEISHAIGKKRKVLGITDIGFYKALVQKINEGV
ncbi:Ribosomal protein L7Ae [Lactobacillus bombicola]|uniref:50S ribosomal protein L7 n=1 Tax=Lactobacillus bombicola TaxID=1505723 RepID=A0A1I1RC12_9LACO|nr:MULTISPECIES: ribosomal L7Ae/L30e/S12e/Gadd45 family protein [Lactobacillus]MCO6528498.1 ribosomal L7Ae/L30e/S12e/Gadd45 family protein [Lactobacillus sp.]RHW48586.1 50S ribosomal protein L7 [Lactobacillus bombicola]RHW52838.1 50S ribosomal protein L7 [Lactobacillus bombicola]RHW55411.1 50S ribosomal protein L7 [Lactobacillus bombicola]RMC41597.1 50S ribosomal protein L7 [Lactobacillus sp. ESL0233]